MLAGMDNERFYPATPDETYRGLLDAVRSLHNFKSADDFSRAVSFTTPPSGFSWGARMSAYVIPERDASIVRLSGTAKVRTNITAKSPEYKHTVQLLDAIGAHIQRNRQQRT